MIEWDKKAWDNGEAEFAKVEAYRAIAEQLEKFNNFVKYASVGGMGLTTIYFGLKIMGVF